MVFLGVAIWAFLWAVRSGQFDDMEGPAHRILMDDDDPRIPGRSKTAEDDKPPTDAWNGSPAKLEFAQNFLTWTGPDHERNAYLSELPDAYRDCLDRDRLPEFLLGIAR